MASSNFGWIRDVNPAGPAKRPKGMRCMYGDRKLGTFWSSFQQREDNPVFNADGSLADIQVSSKPSGRKRHTVKAETFDSTAEVVAHVGASKQQPTGMEIGPNGEMRLVY